MKLIFDFLLFAFLILTGVLIYLVIQFHKLKHAQTDKHKYSHAEFFTEHEDNLPSKEKKVEAIVETDVSEIHPVNYHLENTFKVEYPNLNMEKNYHIKEETTKIEKAEMLEIKTQKIPKAQEKLVKVLREKYEAK